MQLSEIHVDQGLIKRGGSARSDLSKEQVPDPVVGLFSSRQGKQEQSLGEFGEKVTCLISIINIECIISANVV